jgi:hypothetical protein
MGAARRELAVWVWVRLLGCDADIYSNAGALSLSQMLKEILFSGLVFTSKHLPTLCSLRTSPL